RHRLAGLDEIIRGVGVLAEHRDALPHLQRGHPGSDGIDDAPRFVARISGWKGITEPRAPFPWGNVRRTDTATLQPNPRSTGLRIEQRKFANFEPFWFHEHGRSVAA